MKTVILCGGMELSKETILELTELKNKISLLNKELRAE